jgi:hypothetical protein
MPIFIPSNSSGFFDVGLYPRYSAQGKKEDLWALQYYLLLDTITSTIDEYLEVTVVSSGTPTFAIMTYNAGTDDASDAFYRTEKLNMANHIAGGNLTKPVVWCAIDGCSLSFPVNMSDWTAGILAGLGV